MDLTTEEPPWKKIKLTLERPYKDDHGEHILNVLDITQDGEYILEPRESTTQELSNSFNRIFIERGHDFFEKLKSQGLNDDSSSSPGGADPQDDSSKPDNGKQSMENHMTPEALFQMRMDTMPQLHVALGEMSHARDLLSVLLSDGGPDPAQGVSGLPKGCLTTARASKPTEIPSLRAFNSQLILGGKDEALRKAAAAFKAAADASERGRVRGEKYWSNALKTRSANWGLVPAPLPPGAPTDKGADKSARDFWITFGLAESPIVFKRQAMAHLAVHDFEEVPLVFPRHQATRMRISLVTTDGREQRRMGRSSWLEVDSSLDSLLRSACNEIVDQEIFSHLIKEAALLPTASVSVSERLIVIEAAQDSELRFELVEGDSLSESSPEYTSNENAICDLIHSSLTLLLLRAHMFVRSQRLSAAAYRTQRPMALPPPLLLPVYNILQYQLFCQRVEKEMRAMEKALKYAGVPGRVSFEAVGETGTQLVDHLRGEDKIRIGGDALLRTNNRHTLRFTFLAPSTLVAHLPQATVTITSVPQLCQLLQDEVERCLLDSIRRLGKSRSASLGGTWFIDKLNSKCVGRWETTLLTFKLSFAAEGIPNIGCEAMEARDDLNRPTFSTYTGGNKEPILHWVEAVIGRACDVRHSLD